MSYHLLTMRMLALVLLTLHAPSRQDSACPFAPKDMSAARSRIEHQAIIEGFLVNHGDDAPLEVRAAALNSEGKTTGDFEPLKVETVRSGRAARLKLILKNQPDFAGYRLTCLSGGKQWTFVAREIQKELVLEKGELAAAPASDASVAGAELIFGRMVNKTYSGDVLALRLRIPKPLDGKLTVKVTLDGKKVGDLSTRVNKTDWKLDAIKAFEKEAVPNVVAYDAKKDHVVVTLFNVKKEVTLDRLKFDIIFESGKQKWTWDELTDPFLALK